MRALMKSELRKLLSVRSTYIASGFVILLTIFIVFYFEGWKGNSGSAAATLGPTALRELVINGAGLAAQMATIVAILFIVHEYRYNLINHTLTANPNRIKVLLAKILVISSYSLVFMLITVLIGMGAYFVGLSLRDAALPAQDFPVWSLVGRTGMYILGSTLFAMIIGTIARSIVGTFALVFLVPSTVESLLGFLLKENGVYLPFTALGQLLVEQGTETITIGSLGYVEAALVTTVYLLFGWLVAGWLFVRRDAS